MANNRELSQFASTVGHNGGNIGIGTDNPGTILDIRDTKTAGSTQVRVYNTDNSNATTQTAEVSLTPDSRGLAGAGIKVFKENADFSTNAGRDISLALNVVQNNSQTEAVRITSSGNVGIGTDNPEANLQIQDASEPTVSFLTGSTKRSAFQGQSTGTYIYSYQEQPILFSVGSGNSFSEKLRITSAGTVKIGSNTLITPSTDADNFVIDTGDVDSGLSILSATTGRIYFCDAASTDQGSIRYVHSDDSMRFETNSSERLRITSDGNLELKTGEIDIQGGNKTVKTSAGFLQVGTSGSHHTAIITAGSERLRILSDGKVAIGDVTANSLLDVHGGDGISITHSGDTFLQSRTTGTTGTNYLEFKDSGGASGAISYHHDGNSLRFKVNGSERLRITSDGKVGIGEDSPDGLLVIKGDSNGASNPSIRLKDGSDTREAWITNASGDLILANGGTDNTPHCKITMFDGNIIIFETANTERLRIDANGYATLKCNSSNLARLSFNNVNSTRIEYSDTSGDLTFYTNSAARVKVGYGGGFRGVTDNNQALGSSSNRWTAVYAVNGTIQTSDEREKTGITTSTLGSDFIKQLRPVSYKWNVGENVVTKDEDGETDVITPRPGERTHWGFIAQEVKQAVDTAGVDFGGWILTDKDDPDSTQGLRYDQFIAPLTKALQEAITKIETLETQNVDLLARVTALEG